MSSPGDYEFPEANRYLRDFFAWCGESEGYVPTNGELMEYLWGHVPLEYSASPQVAEEIRVTLGQYLSRLRRAGQWQADNIPWDKRTFRRRFRNLATVPRQLWLTELRRLVENAGCTPRRNAPWDKAQFPSLDLGLEDLSPPDHPAGFEGFPPLERLARKCRAVEDIKALIEVIGDRSTLTAKGNLSLSDARHLAEMIDCTEDFDEKIGHKIFKTKSSIEIEPVDLAFRWARAARLVKVAKGKVSPTRNGNGFGTHVFEDWWTLFDSFVNRLGWPRRRYPSDRMPFWAEDVAALIPWYIDNLRHDPRGAPIAPLRDGTWRTIEDNYMVDDLTPEQVESQIAFIGGCIIHGLFEPLTMLHAIDPATLETEWIKPTPLGTWAVERLVYLRSGQTAQPSHLQSGGNVIWLHQRGPGR